MKNSDIYLSFDLDNTLIKNTKGIINSFNYALEKYKKEKIPPKIIKQMIGIPLHEMFKEVTNESPEKYISTFRDFYRKKGIYQSKLIKGVRKKLKELKENGFLLGVLSSKKHEMVHKILKILKINHFFDLYLGETEQRKKKYDPITKKILEENFPNKQIIVIGDHANDVKVAEMLGCPFIGVLTGTTIKEKLIESISVSYLILKSIRDLNANVIYSILKEK